MVAQREDSWGNTGDKNSDSWVPREEVQMPRSSTMVEDKSRARSVGPRSAVETASSSGDARPGA